MGKREKGLGGFLIGRTKGAQTVEPGCSGFGSVRHIDWLVYFEWISVVAEVGEGNCAQSGDSYRSGQFHVRTG